MGFNQHHSALMRFSSGYIPVTESGCWLWERTINSYGYAKFLVNGKQIGVHRFAYITHRGPIPDGLQLDHTCRVRSCVNPWHLEPVTIKENVLRGNGLAAQNKKKTHCKHGHEYAPENTRIRVNGCRACRTCQRLSYRKKEGAA